MILYWVLLLIPSWHLFLDKSYGQTTKKEAWGFYLWFLVLVVGLRFQVGGDWFTYLEGLEIAGQLDWSELFDARKEAGFTLLSWASLALGLDIYGVNLVCAAIFSFGLIKLAKEQPYPWLAIAAATPYLIIVVAMGYTRQAVAIGLLMYGFGLLRDNRLLHYLIIVVVAGLFHKTAFIFLPIALFRPQGGVLPKIAGALFMAAMVYGSIIVEQAEFLMRVYVEQTMDSSGGQIRVLMNLPAALLLFLFWKKWAQLYSDRWLWAIFAILAIASLLLVTKASTAVDRIALYFIPLQLVVYSRLPELLKGKISRPLIIGALLSYFGVVQFVWLVFGTHAPYWVPYRFFPAEWLVSLV